MQQRPQQTSPTKRTNMTERPIAKNGRVKITYRYMLFAALISAHPVYAENSDQRAIVDARAIVTASDYDATMDAMISAMAPGIEAGFIGGIASSRRGSEMLQEIDTKYPGGREAFSKRFGELLNDHLRGRYPEFREEATKYYAALLSPQELKNIRKFQESPSGKRLRAVAPEMQKKMADMGRIAGEQAGMEAADVLLDEFSKHLDNPK